MTGGVTGPGGTIPVQFEGKTFNVTPEEMFMQQMTEELMQNPETAKLLGHKPTADDVQTLLFMMIHPETTPSKFAEFLKTLEGQVATQLAEEAGLGEGWKPDNAKLKLSVYRKFIPAGKFNEIVNKLAEKLNLTPEQKQKLMELYAQPEKAGSQNSDLLNSLFGALDKEMSSPKPSIGLEPPQDLGQFAGDVSGVKESTDINDLMNAQQSQRTLGIELTQAQLNKLQEDVPNLPADSVTANLSSATLNLLKEAQANSWFGPNLLVSLYENILEMISAMQRMKKAELQVVLNSIEVTMTMAKDISNLIIASSEKEAEMLRDKAEQCFTQAAMVGATMVLGLATFGVMRMKGVKTDAAMSMSAGIMQSTGQITSNIVEGIYKIREADATLEKGRIDAQKEFMQQMIQIVQQQTGKASEAQKDLKEQITQILQQFQKWVDEHYQAHTFSRS